MLEFLTDSIQHGVSVWKRTWICVGACWRGWRQGRQSCIQASVYGARSCICCCNDEAYMLDKNEEDGDIHFNRCGCEYV